MDLGARMKASRKSIGLTQKQLAEKLGVAVITIAQYERNKREPSIEILRRIADALEVPMLYLVGGSIGDIFPNSIEEARDEYKKINLSLSAYDGMIAILADIFGGVEERSLVGIYASASITIFGKGENAFSLEDDDLSALHDSIKGFVQPIVSRLTSKYSLDNTIKEIMDVLNDKDFWQKYRDVPEEETSNSANGINPRPKED